MRTFDTEKKYFYADKHHTPTPIYVATHSVSEGGLCLITCANDVAGLAGYIYVAVSDIFETWAQANTHYAHLNPQTGYNNHINPTGVIA